MVYPVETGTVGKRGTWVIPARFRKALGIADGSLIIAELTEQGILLRPARAVPVEIYSNERQAALMLNSAVDEEDYKRMRDLVKKMGLDPEKISHDRPAPDSPSRSPDDPGLR